jgi:gamma-polyglutamate synthase
VIIPLLSLILLLLYLAFERVTLDRLRRAVPIVIAVTGTRGKSSVVRMLSSVLREHGRQVLAKTTGSQAQMLLPDGSVREIPRRGIISILEQKQVLKTAARLHADCVVVEIMSIRPENHFVESQQILKPDIVLVTNVRRDHLEAMGDTESEIAEVFKKALPSNASVYVPKDYVHLFDPSGQGNESILLRPVDNRIKERGATEFAENLDLVAAVSRDLGVADETITRGIQNAQHDIGRLRIWKYKVAEKSVFLVNAFAANDPDSTMMIYDSVAQALSAAPSSISGLLNLRLDRPDRTIQWIETLRGGATGRFRKIFAVDGHSHVLRRKIPTVIPLSETDAGKLTEFAIDQMEDGGILFGFGNIGGMGRQLIEHWQQAGEEYGL